MSSQRTGDVIGVNGNMVTVKFDERVMQNEVAYVILKDARLKSEVIRVKGKYAELQVFENTQGIRIGDKVEFTDEDYIRLVPIIKQCESDGLKWLGWFHSHPSRQ